MEKEFGLDEIYNITGQAEIPAGYPAPKIKWIQENRPEIFAKADKFLLLEDWIIYKMTGKFASSRSLYSSSLLMNVHTGEYIPEMLSYLGITENQLPALKESGEVIGEYKGIKVTTSALDQIAGITGAGVIQTGIMSETTGTALAVCALTDKFPPYYEGIKVSLIYVKKGVYCLMMWAPTAGAMLEWFKGSFCENIDYAKINELAESVPAGSEGLICVPHLCGTVMPENQPNAKGVFFGMELKHHRGHFIRSIMESIAYMIREFFDFMKVDVLEIRSMGGGAKSKLWCEIKSSTLDRKVVTLKENETACLGSAMFAGVGIGVFESLENASNKIIARNLCYEPKYREYQELYKQYKEKEKNLFKCF
jgi:xylulokinase